jgi:hypothetical protein
MLAFPPNPSLNQEVVTGGKTWRWDGTRWQNVGVVGFQGSVGYQGSAGYRGSAGYQGSMGYTGSQGYTGSRGYGYTPLVGSSDNLLTDGSLVGNSLYTVVSSPGAYFNKDFINLFDASSNLTTNSTFFYYGSISNTQLISDGVWYVNIQILDFGGIPVSNTSNTWSVQLTGRVGYTGSTGSGTLAALTDVVVGSPNDGDVLTYVALDDKYHILPLNISSQPMDGGSF